jgi:hypothetical protein
LKAFAAEVHQRMLYAENKYTHLPNYAGDDKPEKQIARAMIRMTIGIKTQDFELKKLVTGDSILTVSCGSCHKFFCFNR